MKRNLYLAAGMLLIFAYSKESFAQCGSNPVQTIEYDTTTNNNGNQTSYFSFPKFNIPTGTLYSVQLQSTLVLNNYSYSLENEESTPVSNFRVRISRLDEVFINDNGSWEPLLDASRNWSSSSISLAAGNGVPGSGPDYTQAGPITVWNNVPGVDETYLGNFSAFLGNGNVDMEYTSTTSGYATGALRYSLVQDANVELNFKLVYTYCPNAVLPGEFLGFSAVKSNNETGYLLNWQVENELPGRKYVIQKSKDGKNFEQIAVLNGNSGNGSGQVYKYTGSRNEKTESKLLFRILQMEPGGEVKYSTIKGISWGKDDDSGLQVYPNPAVTDFTINLSAYKPRDWNIEIFTPDGKLLQQQKISTTNGYRRLQLNNTIQRGMYILKATSVSGGTSVSTKLFVDR